jgi:uncharacterized protein (TIGR02466 family)
MHGQQLHSPSRLSARRAPSAIYQSLRVGFVSQVIGLFPTPVMRVEKFLSSELASSFASQATQSHKITNFKSDRLAHTPIADPKADPMFQQIAKLVAPKLAEFGQHLFGEVLDWSIKEIWINVLEPGGRQAVHTHANSFISGVIYLTRSHPSANIIFHKNLGGSDFIFSNHNQNAKVGPYNGSKWMMPSLSAGDLVLFPSYLLHEVPLNQGDQRISIAFNAIPQRLDNFGYAIRFS